MVLPYNGTMVRGKCINNIFPDGGQAPVVQSSPGLRYLPVLTRHALTSSDSLQGAVLLDVQQTKLRVLGSNCGGLYLSMSFTKKWQISDGCPKLSKNFGLFCPTSKSDIRHFLELQDFGFQLASLVITLHGKTV